MTKSKIVLGSLLLLVHLHAAADATDDAAAAKMVKTTLRETCEDDAACRRAVDEQFDACLKKSDFKKYMNASEAEEDKYLDSTFKHLYSCIVSKDGEPYFAPAEE